MKRIREYHIHLSISNPHIISLPIVNTIFLSIKPEQSRFNHNYLNIINLYFLVDETQKSKDRKFVVCDTLDQIEEKPTEHWEFCGTVQIDGLVYHVFEIIEIGPPE